MIQLHNLQAMIYGSFVVFFEADGVFDGIFDFFHLLCHRTICQSHGSTLQMAFLQSSPSLAW